MGGIKILKLINKFLKKEEEQSINGIEDVLKELYNNKCKLFIASTKPTAFIEKLLIKYNLIQYFEYISGSPLKGECYLKEQIIAEIITKYELDKEETIMIGDRKFDIIGAKSNNIDSIGVIYGIGNLEEINEEKSKHIAHIPKEILDIISEEQ